ncbi:hypothetical protein [Mycobacteroides abscessus]|uniref:hypothetical protein n=2 Tax=Mycobacteroides abscessus TaxID=36809 RepID=UPI0002683E86|nr:hypothetical protein [Mycobacteroides abscessus]OHU67439.1 hypothetical protein BKG87_22390 [Mycobacteroides chelonae]EIV27920.1 hypothetical protein MA3A0119R_1517 [Mycobacteroides abscessus 3A-0119-R]EIV34186.1 hypothetical protein MA3A0122R_1544 [Mycobacteroides abscessus 3A-0122-R]EIV41018.1 hypothetical protein MA3A0731_1481 [Mycobacteroides abscessus 3A-0731]EIV55595.1 hypothetical protein MA3A0930S_1164 [Mycobacteroides abscessus 3A-0930-S]
MSHEGNDRTGSDETRSPAGRRPGEHDPETSADAAAPDGDERDSDHGVRSENGALRAARDELDSAEEALEAEIVDHLPKAGRPRSIISQWSGDLPHPDDAVRYEAIAPGTLDRLISLKERHMSVIEREVEIAERRADTVHIAVSAESDVRRSLAEADTGAIKRGQWQLWSISAFSLAAVITGLLLGYPQALIGILVPIVQAGTALVTTVTQQHRDNSDTSGSRDSD